ncbi:hypothetical protein D3C86_1873640 [compost metagenome]
MQVEILLVSCVGKYLAHHPCLMLIQALDRAGHGRGTYKEVAIRGYIGVGPVILEVAQQTTANLRKRKDGKGH